MDVKEQEKREQGRTSERKRPDRNRKTNPERNKQKKKTGWLMRNRKEAAMGMQAAIIFLAVIAAVAVIGRQKSSVSTEAAAAGVQYVASETAKDPAVTLQNMQAADQNAGISQEQTTADGTTADGSAADASGTTDGQSTVSDGIDPAVIQEQAAPLYEQINSLAINDLSAEELASYQQRFANTVVVGDSMAQAVYEDGLLDGSHVYFVRGASISQLGEQLDEALAMLPTNVIFFTGLNDTDYFDDPNAYAAAYQEKVNQVLAANPSAHVYICSMLPPSDELGAAREDLARAPLYDAALQNLCASSQATYIDLNWMVKQELYLEDGIHFNYYFYVIWLQYAAINLGI